MKLLDIVQIRQWDGSETWIYAKVLDPVTRQVQIQHPGNAEHGQIKIVAAQDIRTKADVEALAVAAQNVVGATPLTNDQLRTLGASDGWINQFTKVEHVKERGTLHLKLVKHYQTQASQLS